MNDDRNQDERDPIATAFDEYQPAPRDVVPRHVNHRVEDLRRLADGTAQVLITHYDVTDQGVTKHTEWATITHPITPNREETP